MFFLLKALIGVSVIGGGVVVPIAINQTISSIKEGKNISQTIGSVAGKVIAETTKTIIKANNVAKKNANLQKTLKTIKDKKCELLLNPENQNNWFNALYACEKDQNGKAIFYYVSSEDAHDSKTETNFIKKVSAVDYLEGKKEEIAQLAVTLENNEVINWKVPFNSGWKHFKNVDLNNQCKIQAKELGGNDLRCVLQDANNKDSIYNFSIF